MYLKNSFLSPVVQTMPPSGIRQFFNAAEADPEVISLGVGEPDFVTPKRAIEACVKALNDGRTMYTPNEGLMELREEIAGYLNKYFKMSYDPVGEILVTVGGSEAIDLALRALLTPGDEVVIPVPGYVAYSPLVRLNGGVPIELELSDEHDFKLTEELLQQAITSRTKAVIVNYPSNPTGAVMKKEDWLPIVRLAIQHNLIVITDEMYAELTYDGQHDSIASLPGMRDRTLVVSGFSKAFAMTGWRIGYLCGPKQLLQEMVKIHQYTICVHLSWGKLPLLNVLRTDMKKRKR